MAASLLGRLPELDDICLAIVTPEPDVSGQQEVEEEEVEEGQEPGGQEAGPVDVVEDVIGVTTKVGDVVVVHLDAGAAVIDHVDGDELGLEELWYVEED